MVLLHQDNFDELYDKVKQKTCASDAEVIAFVAMDADALCACRMLTVRSLSLPSPFINPAAERSPCRRRPAQELFKFDHIRFAIHPVASYNGLQTNFRELLAAQPEVRLSLCV